MHVAEEILNRLSDTNDQDALWLCMTQIIHGLGFKCFSYVDVRQLPLHDEALPFYQTSVRSDFVETYVSMGLLGYDPVVTRAASSNAAFTWADCLEFDPRIRRRAGPKGRAWQVMGLAKDHGYTQGFAMPLHAVDHRGQPASALLSLYWTEAPEEMDHAIPFWLKLAAATYHERLLHFRGLPQVSVDTPPSLTDREREILVWACRGKTRSETADILNITERTVEYHFENAMRKLGVHNKFHAIAVAVQSRLIAP